MTSRRIGIAFSPLTSRKNKITYPSFTFQKLEDLISSLVPFAEAQNDRVWILTKSDSLI